eukprot:COSAG01_NODE_7309_length_3257_cov_5.117163_3_plen_75_part_00
MTAAAAAATVQGQGAIPSTSELAVAKVNAAVARAEPVGGHLRLSRCLSTRPFLTGMCLPMHAPRASCANEETAG